jgi:hypothetical protein
MNWKEGKTKKGSPARVIGVQEQTKKLTRL